MIYERRFLLPSVLMLLSSCLYADIRVQLNAETTGPIKRMNAVNNGPVISGSSQQRDNFQAFSDCHIPMARTHDASFNAAYGGEHTVDISAIFPDFSRRTDDPEAYDFAMTDTYLSAIRKAGTDIFFRLGQRIEHGVKKYHTYPPADYGKWAEICEHIIRHYNEGWAGGFRWGIRYWEIWNEPDLDSGGDAWKRNPRTWGGSREEFFAFYRTAARHLKRCFPDLMIGGPAIAGNEEWGEAFLRYMAEQKVDIDFFSWHVYGTQPKGAGEKASRIRKLMQKYGYGEAESILNEWNYVKGWTDAYQYSVNTISNDKGAAFVASTMIVCQNNPVDMLMYYDARVGTVFNGLFDFYTYAPTPVYYAFYAWSRLLRLGSQLPVETGEDDVVAVCATDGKGRQTVLLSRYNEDNNRISKKKVKVHLEGLGDDAVICGHLTDWAHLFTEIPLHRKENVLEVTLEPNAFMAIDITDN